MKHGTNKGIFVMLLVLAAFSSASCELETSGNGKLDGMWHLESVDTIDGGSMNMAEKRMFWSFQAKLLQLDNKDDRSVVCMMRFEYKTDALRVYEPVRYDRTNGNEPLAEPDRLRPYGINAIDEKFKIERLSGDKMVLENSTLRLYFTKF